MRDCPSRAARHPMMTPAFHHVLRECAGCGFDGCVVPTCPRNRFRAADQSMHWTEVPASGDARLSWRCTRCNKIASRYAR